MEEIDKPSVRTISSREIPIHTHPDCITEDHNAANDDYIPTSSLPANLSPLRDSFEETNFEFTNTPPQNCFDASFKYANELNRTQSGQLSANNDQSYIIRESLELLTISPLPKIQASINDSQRHPVFSAQVSFCQAPPIEHEYPPRAPRRHFSFGARTYSEQQRAQSQYSRKHRFSRQKTTR